MFEPVRVGTTHAELGRRRDEVAQIALAGRETTPDSPVEVDELGTPRLPRRDQPQLTEHSFAQVGNNRLVQLPRGYAGQPHIDRSTGPIDVSGVDR